MSGFGSNGKTSVAVITGGHAFDVPNFHRLFRRMGSVDAYIQTLDDFIADAGQARAAYGVLLFYNFPQDTPAEDSRERGALVDALERGQGIFVMHHAVLSYPHWQEWADLVGVPERGFGYHIGETLQVDVVDPTHPITAGVEAWEMVDETYSMASCGDDSHPLLQTDHKLSMTTIAWTRQVANSRVFCLQCGHDNDTWQEPAFQRITEQGIAWCAGG